MRLLFLCFLIAIAVIMIIRYIRTEKQKKKCTGTATGYFAYSDCVESPNPQKMRSLWVPVYEFTVGDMKYLVRSGKGGPGERSFPIEAEIRYDTSNPELCFVNGAKSKLISKYSDPDFVKKEEDPWNEYYENLTDKKL